MGGLKIRAARQTDRCDQHPKIKASARVTGVDNYADEPYLVCTACLDKLKAKQELARQRLTKCDWCDEKKTDVKSFQDREGNRDNVTSNVCGDCRRAYIQKQLTNDYIPGRRRTRSIAEQEAELVSVESIVDSNDDDLTDDE